MHTKQQVKLQICTSESLCFQIADLKKKILRTKLPTVSKDSMAQVQICELVVKRCHLIHSTEIIYNNISL